MTGGPTMDEWMAALEQAFADYRQDLENYEKKRKPTDGLLGLGHSLQNDPCHDRLPVQKQVLKASKERK